MKFYLSTTADIEVADESAWPIEIVNTMKSANLAKTHGMGIEIAEFCISENLESGFDKTCKEVYSKTELVPDVVLHAPYNELLPCAIEPKVLEVAKFRYDQAWELCKKYGAKKMIVHSGFYNQMFFESWFTERAIVFWKEFLETHTDDITVCMENVVEVSPDSMLKVAESVNDPRFKLTFDVGHAHRSSEIPVMEWLEKLAPYISHFHIHNNEGVYDTHNALGNGTIPMEDFLNHAKALCPDATFTVESLDLENSLTWLEEKGFLNA
ncbi:MAG: sugar phosphate isomerase/epimerase [Lachnospiraceae bacterium]|nr:sugar phosphate isomerase/epimerase [Lachnospiraceae bacterium]